MFSWINVPIFYNACDLYKNIALNRFLFLNEMHGSKIACKTSILKKKKKSNYMVQVLLPHKIKV